MKKQKRRHIKCRICKKVMKGTQGLRRHMDIHKDMPVQGKNWDYVVLKQPDPKPKRKYTKRNNRPVITPKSEYVDVPVILRVPLTMGPIQIIQLGMIEAKK